MASNSASNPPPSVSNVSAMFRPPIDRAMRVLDRSFFLKKFPISAATVFESPNISRVRAALTQSEDILLLPRLGNIRLAPGGSVVTGKGGQTTEAISDPKNKKCILLQEWVKHDDATTWSPTLNELLDKGTIGLGPYELELNYDYWSYPEIMKSILLEEDLEGELPMGFTQSGHVVHLNLREQYLPYRHLIAQILLDKNPHARTVINKTEDVGSHSQFRTFPFEVLAGDKDTNVVLKEQDCEFRFDFSRVYWNSRLDTEHRRLVEKFSQGQLVCDVMAGVGPFAVPAGRKKIFVWANDLNPYGWEVMEEAIRKNKVKEFVKAFNMDGRDFIQRSAREFLEHRAEKVDITPKGRADRRERQGPSPERQILVRPPTVDHYVMNLPATAIEFLDAFIGSLAGKESLFEPHTDRKLPMIHVYCFSGHSDNVRNEHVDICQRISERMGFTMTPDDTIGGTGNSERELEIYNVRLVSPQKQMFCASFRLPREVAFRSS